VLSKGKHPDKSYRKFYLDESSAKKVFKAWSPRLEALMIKYKGTLSEDALVEMIELINKERSY
jgi:hypothetical protein